MEPPCGVWSANPWPPGRDLVFLTRPVAILGIGGLPRNPLHSTSERLWWARMCLLFAEHHAAAFSPWVGVIVRFMMVKLIPSDAFLKWDMVSGLGTMFEFVGRRVFPGDDMIFIACLFSQHHYVRWDLFGCKFDEPFVWWEIYFIWKRLPNLQKKIAVEPFHKPFKFIPRNTKSNQIMKGHFTPKVTSNHTNMPAHTHTLPVQQHPSSAIQLRHPSYGMSFRRLSPAKLAGCSLDSKRNLSSSSLNFSSIELYAWKLFTLHFQLAAAA